MGRWISTTVGMRGLVNGDVYYEPLYAISHANGLSASSFGDGCRRNLELNQLPPCVFYFNGGITVRTVLGHILVVVHSQAFLRFQISDRRLRKVPPGKADGTFPKAPGFISHINLLNCP